MHQLSKHIFHVILSIGSNAFFLKTQAENQNSYSLDSPFVVVIKQTAICLPIFSQILFKPRFVFEYSVLLPLSYFLSFYLLSLSLSLSLSLLSTFSLPDQSQSVTQSSRVLLNINQLLPIVPASKMNLNRSINCIELFYLALSRTHRHFSLL